MTDDARRTRREGIAELAEDAVGFGGQELRLTRDLILRPRAVMDAYDAHGSTAGGRYPKPLRYWLTLNGLYLLFMAISGGMERAVMSNGSSAEAYGWLAERAGKSVEEFIGDMEQWITLVSLPIYAGVVGGALYLLIRRWSPGDDRQDFRQTFTLLNALALWGIPFSVAASLFGSSEASMLVSLALYPLITAVLYAVLGKGRWWRSAAGAWGKGVVLVLALLLAIVPYSLIGAAVAIGAASLLP